MICNPSMYSRNIRMSPVFFPLYFFISMLGFGDTADGGNCHMKPSIYTLEMHNHGDPNYATGTNSAFS